MIFDVSIDYGLLLLRMFDCRFFYEISDFAYASSGLLANKKGKAYIPEE